LRKGLLSVPRGRRTSQFGSVAAITIRLRGWPVLGVRQTGCASRHSSGGRYILAPVRRGILGGTFDPPHLAHLFAGEVAYTELGLDVVSYLPAGAPWQKAEIEVSDASHRWEMTNLAVAAVEYFESDDREVRRDGWTYTVDTLREFDGDELVLILGSDAAVRLPSWRLSEEVIRLAEVAVVPRPGFSRDDVGRVIERFQWLDGPELDLSGTMLRGRIREGRSVRYLVPHSVDTYIKDNGLYRDPIDAASP
jgi:nicotinate-nucleotide adenylyltransferase